MILDTRFENAELAIVLSETADAVTLSWYGSSDSRDPAEFLEPVFQKAIGRLKGRPLTIDFSRLEFMNSSTVSPIVSLLKLLDGRKMQARVVFGRDEWQQVHIRCMRTITRALKHVDVVGPAASDSVPNDSPGAR